MFLVLVVGGRTRTRRLSTTSRSCTSSSSFTILLSVTTTITNRQVLVFYWFISQYCRQNRGKEERRITTNQSAINLPPIASNSSRLTHGEQGVVVLVWGALFSFATCQPNFGAHFGIEFGSHTGSGFRLAGNFRGSA